LPPRPETPLTGLGTHSPIGVIEPQEVFMLPD